MNSAGSSPGTGRTSRSAPAWVVSFVPSGTLSWAIVIPSSCIMAENKVTCSFSSVQEPRRTFPSTAISHPPFRPSGDCAASQLPVISSMRSPLIPERTLQIVPLLGNLYLSLNQSHSAPIFPSRDCDMSCDFLAISEYPFAPASTATTLTARTNTRACCFPFAPRGSSTERSISRRLEMSASLHRGEHAGQPEVDCWGRQWENDTRWPSLVEIMVVW